MSALMRKLWPEKEAIFLGVVNCHNFLQKKLLEMGIV